MNKVPLKIKYGKESYNGSMGTSWSDYTFEEYIKYLKALENGTKEEIFSSLTNVPAEVWKKPHKAELFSNIEKVLAFVNVTPSTVLPTHIEEDGFFYEINDNFMTLPLSQYWDMLELIKQVQAKEGAQQWENSAIISKVIAVLACKKDNIKDIEETAKVIDGMTCDVVCTIGAFFFKKLSVLKGGIQAGPDQKDSLLNKLKRVMVKFLAILVICIHYITSPKEILLNLKRLCLTAWRRFTGGNSYRVISMKPMKSTKKFKT